jgi:hypothetical protein
MNQIVLCRRFFLFRSDNAIGPDGATALALSLKMLTVLLALDFTYCPAVCVPIKMRLSHGY